MKETLLYVGGTGCGKTYKAIKENGSGDFVIAVPCRQLAYEIWLDYPDEISRIDTGEIHLGDKKAGQVCVYENLPDHEIDRSVLIVDEAQYLNDPQRGGALLQKVLNNRAAGKQVILLTATDSLSSEVKAALGVRVVEVSPFMKPPRKVRLRQENFANRVYAGMKTIVFCRHVPDEGKVRWYSERFGIDTSNFSTLSSATPSYERLAKQIAYRNGEIQVMLATNLLAQGINMPAEGVWIEPDSRDTWELIDQKIGRIARPHFGMDEGYYHIRNIPRRRVRYGLPDIVEEAAVSYRRPSGEFLDIRDWGFSGHEVPKSLEEYQGFKYSRKFLSELSERVDEIFPEEAQALEFLDSETRKLEGLLARG